MNRKHLTLVFILIFSSIVNAQNKDESTFEAINEFGVYFRGGNRIQTQPIGLDPIYFYNINHGIGIYLDWTHNLTKEKGISISYDFFNSYGNLAIYQPDYLKYDITFNNFNIHNIHINYSKKIAITELHNSVRLLAGTGLCTYANEGNNKQNTVSMNATGIAFSIKGFWDYYLNKQIAISLGGSINIAKMIHYNYTTPYGSSSGIVNSNMSFGASTFNIMLGLRFATN